MKVEITPTSHAFYVRFTFPDDAANTNVIFDNLWSSGTLKFDDEGKTFQATTNHGKKMLVYGVFDQNPASATVIGGKSGNRFLPAGHSCGDHEGCNFLPLFRPGQTQS